MTPRSNGASTSCARTTTVGDQGSIPAEAVEQHGLITGSTDKNDFADCDIVIEAVFEDMGLKK